MSGGRQETGDIDQVKERGAQASHFLTEEDS